MLHLLLPDASRLPHPLPDALARVLGRADIDPAHDIEAALRLAFPQPPMPWQEAALARLIDADDTDIADHLWLRADPALIQPDLNGARLLAVGPMLPLSAEDAAAWLPALRPLFGDAGFALDAPHPQRWYLRMPAGTPLPIFPTPAEALGEDPFDHQPRGDAAAVRRWRVLANEAQVLLHTHPHTARRRAAGLPGVNALWFHGAGRLPHVASSHFPTLLSDDPLLRGLARLAKIDAGSPPEGFVAMDHALIDLRSVPAPALLPTWLLPAAAHAGEQAWTFEGGPSLRLAPAQRWRFWRRPVARIPAA